MRAVPLAGCGALNELAAHLRLVEIEAPRARGTNVDGEATVAGALGDVLDIELAPVPAAVGEEAALRLRRKRCALGGLYGCQRGVSVHRLREAHAASALARVVALRGRDAGLGQRERRQRGGRCGRDRRPRSGRCAGCQ